MKISNDVVIRELLTTIAELQLQNATYRAIIKQTEKEERVHDAKTDETTTATTATSKPSDTATA